MLVLASLFCAGLFVACFSLLPSVSLAETLSGGFPPRNIWLSRDSATAGDTVTIYAAVGNGSAEKIEGTVAFILDGKKIGTNEFILEGGKSSIQSVAWSATAGTHTISAKIEGAVLSNMETGAIEITVTAPPPSPVADALNTASGAASTIIASSSPFVLGAATTIFSTTESLRTRGQDYFDTKVAERQKRDTRSNIEGFGSEGIALGTSTERASDSTFGSMLASAQDGFYNVGQIIFRSAAFFYPFFALLFFILLYLATKWAQRRPRIR